MNNKKEYSEIIKNIAEQNGVSEESVYADMQTAINMGYHNLDPAVQEYWTKLFPDGEIPIPEEVIKFLAEEIKNLKINKIRRL
jgi:hypothetical protein